MAKLKDAALAAAQEIAANQITSVHNAGVVRDSVKVFPHDVARIIETHMRSLLEQTTDVARLWAVVRGDHDSRWAAEELARELRAVMEGA